MSVEDLFPELDEHARRRVEKLIDDRVEVLAVEKAAAIARRSMQASEAGRIGTYEIDLSVGFATGSPRFMELFGYPIEQAGITTEQWMNRIHPEDRDAAADHLRRLLRSATAANSGEYRVEINGQTRWLKSCDRVDRNADGRAVYAFGIVEDITERKTYEAGLWHAAHHDALTGLPNRVMFQAALRRAVEGIGGNVGRAGVVMFDLDRLKRINDRWGHGVGDEVLVAVAIRLSAAATLAGGMAARLGGDEFAILLNDMDSEALSSFMSDSVPKLAATLNNGAVTQPYSVSAGGAVFPEHGGTPAELARNADLALCRAKHPDGSRWLLYSPGIEQVSDTKIDGTGSNSISRADHGHDPVFHA